MDINSVIIQWFTHTSTVNQNNYTINFPITYENILGYIHVTRFSGYSSGNQYVGTDQLRATVPVHLEYTLGSITLQRSGATEYKILTIGY